MREFNIVNVEKTKFQLKSTLKEIIELYFKNEMPEFSHRFQVPLSITLGEFHEIYYLKSLEYKKFLNDWFKKKGLFFKNLLSEESGDFVRYYFEGTGKQKKEKISDGTESFML